MRRGPRGGGQPVSDDDHRERVLNIFAPVSASVLLPAWVTQQIVGFGLIWWGLGERVQAIGAVRERSFAAMTAWRGLRPSAKLIAT